MDGVANSASQQAWRVARALSGRILAQGKSGNSTNSVWSPAYSWRRPAFTLLPQ